MKGTEVPNPQRSSACDSTCVSTRIDHYLVVDSLMYAMHIRFVPAYAKYALCMYSEVFEELSYSLVTTSGPRAYQKTSRVCIVPLTVNSRIMIEAGKIAIASYIALIPSGCHKQLI